MFQPIQVVAVHDDGQQVMSAQQLGWHVPSVNSQEYHHAVRYCLICILTKSVKASSSQNIKDYTNISSLLTEAAQLQAQEPWMVLINPMAQLQDLKHREEYKPGN